MSEFADKLREQTAAVRLHRSRFGARKAISKDQKQRAASLFYAENDMLSASKKLLDTKDTTYRAVTSILSQAAETWKSYSVPFPEPGIRLIRRDRIEGYNNAMVGLVAQLDQAVAALNVNYWELKGRARTSLGDLFNSEDYPDNLDDEFALKWDFPSVDPPAYLQTLNPALYAAEEERIKRRFEDAVQLAEQAFADEFQKLISNLADKLTGIDDNGVQKQFKDSSVHKLHEFFEKFRELNVRSNPELDALVEQAHNCVAGQTPEQLRSNGGVRVAVGEALKMVTQQLDDMLVRKPKRVISFDDNE